MEKIVIRISWQRKTVLCLKMAAPHLINSKNFNIVSLKWRRKWQLIVKVVFVIFSKNAEHTNAVEIFLRDEIIGSL